MKKFFLLAALLLMSMSCTQRNPFLRTWDTPYGAIPFDRIQIRDYLPAFKEGIRRHNLEIEAIANNPETPTFDNTVAALDASGLLLSQVELTFDAMLNNETCAELQELAEVVTPLISEHYDNISLNEALFRRIETLYQNREALGLDLQQTRLLEKYYQDFVHEGAALDPDKKERLRQLNLQLSQLTLKFSDNVLKETNAYRLVVDDPARLSGLPQGAVQAAAETAQAEGMPGKWVFTLHNPSRLPVLQYADDRDLREQIFKAYIMKGDNDNENDNKAIVLEAMKARIEKAKLLGYENFAYYQLEDQMAKTPEAAFELMDMIWKPALAKAKEEAAELQQMIYADGQDFKLEAWDWWYYTEKLRKAKFDMDEEEIRPYFQMENVREGLFKTVNLLYGLQFKPLDNIPVYHPDVEVFEVTDADGSLIGLFYSDYFPREGKRSGAWMSELKSQYLADGVNVRPHIYNVGNLNKPTADTPSLLSIDDVETMFHEFGHALHGLLSQCTYRSLSGTNVPRDFVELPSQIMEKWCMHPEVLKLYAKHYRTGEPIPAELIDKINRTRTFNQGFKTTELLAAAYLDMYWHTLSEMPEEGVREFESRVLNQLGLIPEIVVRYRTTYFNHIFSSGYCAGYYAYLWAEVLDSDAFSLFEQNGIFDQATAVSFRQNILEKGNTEDLMTLYRRYRGADPSPKALLRFRGLTSK